MKILLIGGTGFVSGTVAKVALEAGHDVTVVTRGIKPIPAGLKQITADRFAPGSLEAAIANAGNPTVDIAADGHGTVIYHYTYTDCAGHNYPWQFVYTVVPEAFTTVADADTTVHCAADVFTPATPTVTVCDSVVPFTLTGSSFVSNSGCGDSIYTFSYTVNDTVHTWTYIYHIVPVNFSITATGGEATVHCLADISADSISLPTITDACGNSLTPGTVSIDSSNVHGCQGDIVYSYPYTDCAGNSHSWAFTFSPPERLPRVCRE